MKLSIYSIWIISNTSPNTNLYIYIYIYIYMKKSRKKHKIIQNLKNLLWEWTLKVSGFKFMKSFVKFQALNSWKVLLRFKSKVLKKINLTKTFNIGSHKFIKFRIILFFLLFFILSNLTSFFTYIYIYIYNIIYKNFRQRSCFAASKIFIWWWTWVQAWFRGRSIITTNPERPISISQYYQTLLDGV